MLRYDVFYSPDDNGWYAEIFKVITGETIKTTRVVKTKEKAKESAKRFIEKKMRETNGQK